MKKPLTPAQIKQRRDASHSPRNKRTGPITERGKSVASQNAFKTGHFAQSSRAAMQGKPCKTTCPKIDTCAFVAEGNTQPGGKCLDVMDWAIVEETTEAIRAYRNGDTEQLHNIQGMIMGQNLTVIQQIFANVQEDGLWVTHDVFNKDGEVVGQKQLENPHITTMLKMVSQLGISMPEMLVTPRAQAQAQRDDAEQQTGSEIVRELGRLLPQTMAVPQFDADEIMDAEVVEKED